MCVLYIIYSISDIISFKISTLEIYHKGIVNSCVNIILLIIFVFIFLVRSFVGPLSKYNHHHHHIFKKEERRNLSLHSPHSHKMATSDKSSSSNQRNKKVKKRIIVEVIIAVVIIGLAVLLCFNLKKLVMNRIFKAIELKPNSEGFNTWLSPPTTITRGYYLFNITNPIDIVTDPSSATVQLQETPPYSYLLSASKKHIQWSDDNKAISYSIYRVFTRHETRFNPSSVDDKGVFVDLLRASFRTQFGAKPTPAFYALGGNNPFYYRNAVEQLEGFTSDLFYAMQDKMTGPNTAKSGFIYRYNGSRTYNFTIKSGMIR